MFSQVLIQSSGLVRQNAAVAVAFTIRTVYDPVDFDVQNTDISATVPNITTTQSVTQAPKQVFNSGQ